MTREQKIERLLWVLPDWETNAAETFLRLFEEMRQLEHEEAEEQRVQHAREMSQRSRR